MIAALEVGTILLNTTAWRTAHIPFVLHHSFCMTERRNNTFLLHTVPD